MHVHSRTPYPGPQIGSPQNSNPDTHPHPSPPVAQLLKSWLAILGFDPWEKEMTTYSSTLAWEIPRTEEPGGLQSMVHGGHKSRTRFD